MTGEEEFEKDMERSMLLWELHNYTTEELLFEIFERQNEPLRLALANLKSTCDRLEEKVGKL